jgi:hypothetical protein
MRRRMPSLVAPHSTPASGALSRSFAKYGNTLEPFDDGALILRVLHGARNVPGVLGS